MRKEKLQRKTSLSQNNYIIKRSKLHFQNEEKKVKIPKTSPFTILQIKYIIFSLSKKRNKND